MDINWSTAIVSNKNIVVVEPHNANLSTHIPELVSLIKTKIGDVHFIAFRHSNGTWKAIEMTRGTIRKIHTIRGQNRYATTMEIPYLVANQFTLGAA